MKKLIADFQSSKGEYPDHASWWEMLKVAIQVQLKQYSKQQAMRRKKTISTMESQILQVNQRLAALPDDPTLSDQKVRLDHLLADYYGDTCEAARVKAGLKHHCEGKRPIRYFTALVKQRAESSDITSLTCIRNGNNVSMTHIEDILEEASNFYATLYSCKLSDAQMKSAPCYLKKNVVRKLTASQKDFCDEPLTTEELGSALKKLSSGKAPGIDGLPTEFFKMFWNELKNDFVEVLNESFSIGSLPNR